MPKVLTKSEYLQLVGLDVLAQKHCAIVKDCVESMAKLMAIEDLEDAVARGWEVAFGDRSLDEALKLMDVTVEDR